MPASLLRAAAKRLPAPLQRPLRAAWHAWRRRRAWTDPPRLAAAPKPRPVPKPLAAASEPAAEAQRSPPAVPIRTFRVRLPVPPARPSGAGASTAIRSDPASSLHIVAPRKLYIPKVLEPTGLAGHDAPTLACFLAAAEQMPIGTIFDIGSNVGIFSLLATSLTQHRVVAFEPSPDIAAVARAIAARNGLEPVVEDLALGATDGSATLFLSPTDSSNSLLAGFREATGDLSVTVERLDSYCARTGVTPGLLKIDTEATEPDVLRGASRLLRETRPWMICEVLAGRTEAELTALLEPLGYAWYRIGSEVPLRRRTTIEGDPTYAEMNWLLAPEPPSDLFWRRMRAWLHALAECQPD